MLDACAKRPWVVDKPTYNTTEEYSYGVGR